MVKQLSLSLSLSLSYPRRWFSIYYVPSAARSGPDIKEGEGVSVRAKTIQWGGGPAYDIPRHTILPIG